ncbi:hypothetical protein EMIT0P228_130072 [Pseudomonas brassicacearum]
MFLFMKGVRTDWLPHDHELYLYKSSLELNL